MATAADLDDEGASGAPEAAAADDAQETSREETAGLDRDLASPRTLPAFEVLLLKDQTSPCKYEAALAPRNGAVAYCPVLGFDFVPGGAQRVADALVLEEGGGEAQIIEVGIVVTSPRAAEVAAEAAQLAARQGVDAASRWRWFPVGEETAARLGAHAAGASSGKAGSAKALLPEIEAWHGESPETRRILFLSGNLRRDTIPLGLQAAGISMEEIVVYRTIPSPQPAIPIAWTASQSSASAARRRFAVFFSPSGVACLANVAPQTLLAPDVQLVAIGKTSAASLETDGAALLAQAAQTRALACPKPSPAGLLAVLEDALL